MAITPSKLATLPTTDMANRDFMANNPQYAPKAHSTSSVSQGTITDDKGIVWNKDAYAQQQADMKKYFPTVMETGTKIDKTIPELQSKGNAIAQEINQSKVNKDVPKTEEQLIADAMKAADQSGMFEESDEMKQLQNMMRQNLDAQTQASLSAIQQQYAQKEALMVKSQKASSKGLENVLNLGGSSRYAPISSMGLVDAKNRYDLETLTQLHAEEESAKSRVLQAQREGNFALMEKQMGRLENLRKEKLSFAQKIAESIAKQNKEIRDKMIQASRDSAVADLVSQGITSPTEIMDILNESAIASGYESSDFTAEEISKALKVFKPTEALSGLDSDYKTYKYLTEIGDPAVDGLNYMEYITAVNNAKRKPEVTTDEEEKEITIPNEKKSILLGAGFTQEEITNIEDDVRNYGINKVLEGISDKTQIKAIQQIYGVKEKVTREQLENTITSKSVYDGLKDSYTVDELKDMADEAGVSSGWTGKEKDVERYLNSEQAKKDYIDMLYEQYKSAGMAE